MGRRSGDRLGASRLRSRASSCTARCNWQTHALLDLTAETNPPTELAPIPAEVDDPMLMLSVAGVTGMTAYFGMRYDRSPVAGDTVLVTAAAGATGSVAGQVARNLGAARVIGTAGSTDKRGVGARRRRLRRVHRPLRRQRPSAAPRSWRRTATTSCSTTSVGRCSTRRCSTSPSTVGWRCAGRSPPAIARRRPEVGLHYYQLLTTRRARMEGFLLYDFEDALRRGAPHAARLVHRRQPARRARRPRGAVENAPLGLRRLFDGGNLGKQILHVADPS